MSLNKFILVSRNWKNFSKKKAKEKSFNNYILFIGQFESCTFLKSFHYQDSTCLSSSSFVFHTEFCFLRKLETSYYVQDIGKHLHPFSNIFVE